jgi:hypothetical protein
MTEATSASQIVGMPYGVTSQISTTQAPSSSFFGASVLKPGYTEILMEYSEVLFLLSEANGWSQTYYEQGVRASMEKWNIDSAKINAFVAALPPANKQNVLTQKYVSLFMQPFEAWAEYRRTGYPNTLLLPEDGKFCTFDCIYCECGFNEDHRPQKKQSISTIYNTYVNDRSLKTCPFYSFGFNESSISMILSRSASLLNGILILPFPLLLHESCTFVPKKVHR